MAIFSRRALALIVLFPAAAHAKRGGGGFGFGLEPIIGYERVQKLVPTVHTSDRLIYGARVTAGFPLLSLEVEYTQGKDTETFADQDLTVQDTAQKVKAGLRSTVSLASALKAFARGGVQGTENVHTETTGGVAVKTKEPIVWDPYAGAGLKIALANKLALTADIVAIFKQWPDMNKNEYLTSVGFEVKVP